MGYNSRMYRRDGRLYLMKKKDGIFYLDLDSNWFNKGDIIDIGNNIILINIVNNIIAKP